MNFTRKDYGRILVQKEEEIDNRNRQEKIQRLENELERLKKEVEQMNEIDKEYILNQLNNGYIDLGIHDEKEIEYLKLVVSNYDNLQSKIDKAIEYIEKNTHNIYADEYRDRMTGELLSKEKTPIINRVFSQNSKDLLDILKEDK